MVTSIIFHICATMHCDIISMTDNVLIPLFIKIHMARSCNTRRENKFAPG